MHVKSEQQQKDLSRRKSIHQNLIVVGLIDHSLTRPLFLITNLYKPLVTSNQERKKKENQDDAIRRNKNRRLRNMMQLSPHAKEFHPLTATGMEDPPQDIVQLSSSSPPPLVVYDNHQLCIFNDGVPSFVLLWSNDRDSEEKENDYDEDDLDHPLAIHEAFSTPCNAQEAAELDAVRDFVELLAQLSWLEDREEHARTTFGHILKRWEVRRAQGLVLGQRPRPARHSVTAVHHGPHSGSSLSSSSCTDLLDPVKHRHHSQLREKALRFCRYRNNKNPHDAMNTKHRYTIQQPRKVN